jgi:hypothetical protein
LSSSPPPPPPPRPRHINNTQNDKPRAPFLLKPEPLGGAALHPYPPRSHLTTQKMDQPSSMGCDQSLASTYE